MEEQVNETTSILQSIDKISSQDVTTSNQVESTSVKTKIGTFIRNITVEPAVLLFTIAMAINGITTQSLIIRKYCLIQMGYPDEICRDLTSNKTLEEQAENMTTNFILYKTLLENLPTVIWSVFIGTWSDSNGRKFLLILPTVGGLIGMILMIFNAYYVTQLNVNYILIASIPYALGGNILSIMTGAISYVADITDTSNRTIRFGFVQAAFLCGLPIGVSSGGYIFRKYGYITVFVVSVCLYIITLLYIIIFIKETISSTDRSSSYAALFKWENVKENLATVYKKREFNGRFHLILLIIIAAISFLPLYAEYNITYLYTRWKFQWDEVTYSNYSTCTFLACLLGLSLVMPFMSLRLKMDDLIIGLLSALSKATTELIIAISTRGWMLFASTVLAIFSGMNVTIVHTMMSKIVSPQEQGKITAVMTAAQACVPAIGSIMFTQLYNATRLNFPGAIYVMSAILALIPAICFGWIHKQRKNITTAL